jgi:hypothetical protein
MKAILVGNYEEKLDKIAYAQLFPFFDNRAKLKAELDLDFVHLQADTFSEIRTRLISSEKARECDVLFVRPTWRHSSNEALDFFSELREMYPTKRIVLIDPWDQLTGRYLTSAKYVDYILKYQGFKDPAGYLRHYVGGTLITDFLSKRYAFDIDDWDVGSSPGSDYIDRILPGWNFATTPRFKKAITERTILERFWRRKRDIDVFCRVSVHDGKGWYGRYRRMAIDKLLPLGSDYNLAVSGEVSGEQKTSSRQYFKEIKRSRIAFSPFGWGEITWRDYEAIAYGCLLVKPHVDHVATNPDVFVPGESYVPVEWDFSDVEDKCRYYLSHWDEAEEIIANARRMYLKYFEGDQFLGIIQRAIS